MRMYLQLPEPVDREELVHRGRVATVLSQMMPKPNHYELYFSQTEDGQVEITSLSRMSRARILDSLEVGAPALLPGPVQGNRLVLFQ